MAFSCYSPNWFFGFDVLFEILFAVVSFILAFFSYKLYRLTSQRDAKLFGVSFFLISLSYAVQSFFNYLVYSKSKEAICNAMKISQMSSLDYMGMYLHMLLMVTGLVFLLYMTLKISNKKVIWVLLTLVLGSMIMSSNPFSTFYLISSICLGFISLYYIMNFLQHRQVLTLLVATAFIFLLFGSIHFFLSVNHTLFYAIGNVLELIAYILILINLILVQKR